MAEGFIAVARLADLDRHPLLSVVVDDELICLTRVDGQIYAFTDNCTHISGPLNQGTFENGCITCPWHGAQFDVRTGKVLRGPARQDLYTYPVRVDGDAILIELPPEA